MRQRRSWCSRNWTPQRCSRVGSYQQPDPGAAVHGRRRRCAGCRLLAVLLAKQGQVRELQGSAYPGTERVPNYEAELLAKHGQVEELRTEVDAGTPYVGYHLADLLIRQGQVEQGTRMKQFGLDPDGSIASPSFPDRRRATGRT
jgi:hypothetical protein